MGDVLELPDWPGFGETNKQTNQQTNDKQTIMKRAKLRAWKDWCLEIEQGCRLLFDFENAGIVWVVAFFKGVKIDVGVRCVESHE